MSLSAISTTTSSNLNTSTETNIKPNLVGIILDKNTGKSTRFYIPKRD